MQNEWLCISWTVGLRFLDHLNYSLKYFNINKVTSLKKQFWFPFLQFISNSFHYPGSRTTEAKKKQNFFHWNQELFGLSRQIGQINSFGVFWAELSAPSYFGTQSPLSINISSVVEFQRWWVLKIKIFAMWWPGFKDFIWFFEMEERGASEAHKNEFLNYEVLKI